MSVLLKRAMFAVVLTLPLAGPAWAETLSPRRLVEVVDIGGLAVSPDGRRVAFRLEQPSIERNIHNTAWYVQALGDDLPPRRVADGGLVLRDTAGIPVPVQAVWSPDGQWIYYLAMIEGRLDVWRAAADGSRAEPLTLDAADVRGFSVDRDGSMLRYRVGASREEITDVEQAEYDGGIHVDERAPVGQTLFRSGNIEGRLATQRYGPMWFARVPLLADVPDRWKAIDLATGARRDLASSEIPSFPPTTSDLHVALPRPWKLALEPGGGRIALLTRTGEAVGVREKPDVELAVLPNRAARRPVVCRDEHCTGQAITDIQWRPNSDDVLFTVTDPSEGLAQSLFRWNVQTGNVVQVVRSEGQLNGRDFTNVPTCSPSHEALVCVAADADRPPRLERIDLETGRRQVLFEPNVALASDMRTIAPARLLRWTDAQGRSFSGQFLAASGSGDAPPPLFITYYRCAGFLRGGVGDEWPLASLAEQGIAVLCINNPPGYPLDAIERFNRSLAGVEAAVALLDSEGLIDRARIGMGGLSFGTEVTLWTAVHSDLLTTVSVSSVAISPLYYLLGSLKENVFLAPLEELWGLGAPEETPERWAELSLVYHLERLRTPVLMQSSEQEYVQTLDYAIPLLREKRADLYVFPHEPHQKFQPRHKLAVYERNLDWFRFWLQGFVDTDARKADQYARWRTMRSRRCERAMEMDDMPWYCRSDEQE